MPVYRRTYRNFEGDYRRSFRWMLVFAQEWRVLLKFKIFLVLMLVAQLHTLLRLLQIVAYDVIMQDPNNVLTPLLSQATMIVVNKRTFYDFVQLQAPMVLLMSLYAGAGMICNDLRNNLLEVYFSKPISWLDYLLGKFLALTALGFSISGLPALALLVLHNIFRPSMELLTQSAEWSLLILIFTLLIVVPCSLTVLACSAVLRSQGFAAITVFMSIIVVSSMGGILNGLMRDRDYILIAFPATLYRLGTELFDLPGVFKFDVPWEISATYVGVVCLVSLFLIARVVRRAEVAS